LDEMPSGGYWNLAEQFIIVSGEYNPLNWLLLFEMNWEKKRKRNRKR
jgi:hypothetical protein